mgnify:CR=1 FL=1
MGLFSDSSEEATKAQKELEKQNKLTEMSLQSLANVSKSVATIQSNQARIELANAKKRGASQAELNQLYLKHANERIDTLRSEQAQTEQMMLSASKNANVSEEAFDKIYKANQEKIQELENTFNSISNGQTSVPDSIYITETKKWYDSIKPEELYGFEPIFVDNKVIPYFEYKVKEIIDGYEKRDIALLTSQFRGVMDNDNWFLLDVDGKPTKWGVWNPD